MSKYVLDYFSSDELRALGLVHFLNCKPLYVLADLFRIRSKILDLNVDALLRHYNIWGPSARTCVELERGTKDVHDLHLAARSAASAFISNPNYFASLLYMLDSTEDSHSLFAIRPHRLKRDAVKVEIPNEHLTNLFLRVLSDLDDEYQYNFGKIMHSDACFFDLNNLMFTQLIRASLSGRSVPEYLRSIPPEASTPVPLKIGKPQSPALHLCLGLGDMVSTPLSANT